MASLGQQIPVSPEFAVPPRIDHDLLADEVRHSRSWPRYMDATQTILSLFLNDEAIGEARVKNNRNDDDSRYPVRSATVESLDIDPGRYHLGLLVTVRSTIVLRPRLITVCGQNYRMVGAAPDIAVHLHGWEHERTHADGVVGFAFNRLNPDPAIPQWETIGREPIT